MDDLLIFAGACGVVLLGLAIMAGIADALGEPERWEARRRNGR
jgi:hypothetical protein